MQPSEVEHLPIEVLDELLSLVNPDTLTFADEQALARYLATQPGR